jgi:hypothetical protein
MRYWVLNANYRGKGINQMNEANVLFRSPTIAFGDDLAKLVSVALETSPEAILARSQAPQPMKGEINVGRPLVCEQRTIAYAGVEDLNGSNLVNGYLVLEVAENPNQWRTLVEIPIAPFRSSAVRDRFRQFPLFRLAWYGQPEPRS